MNECIYVGSLQYSPIYKSHCCAFGAACEARGYYVKYLFSHEYNWMLSGEIKKKTVFVGHSTDISSMIKDALNLKNMQLIRKIFSEDQPTHFYMHNYHLLNHYIAKLAKKYNCKFIYHVHEPYTMCKKAHGGLQQYWLYLFEFLQGRLIDKADIVVLSSKIASYLFESRYPNFSGKKMLIPLMYEDLGGCDLNLQGRKYITFVGPPVPAKNPGKFLEIVRYSNIKGLGLNFLLISRKKVKDPRFYKEKNLEIFHKEKISEEEYGELIKKSLAVITPYKRETQSSVILTSYMYGTPVVTSNVGGLPEFVHHKETGYLVDLNAKIEEWVKGINYIIENFPKMSRECRKYFEENFSGKNWEKYLEKLLS
jgi:glycosyltransferase involved in cell wall biosynthesis